MGKIIVRDRIYVPSDLIDVDDVARQYSKKMYLDAKCMKCEYVSDRHSYMCDECGAYSGELRLAKTVMKKGVEYVGLPIGDKRNLEKKTGLLFDEHRFVDLRVESPFDYKIKFVAQLRPIQDKLVESFWRHQYGMIEAPPRTGKTITYLYIALKLGQKFLVLANQHEFLTQFMDHVYGNVKEGIPRCTNVDRIEERLGHKICGIPKTDEDYKNFQIFCMPYQSFISKNGQARFKRLEKIIGTVAIDEVHKVGASEFAKVVSMFPSRYRFGVSGTINRKDGRQWLTKAIIGPVVARTKIEALTPTVHIHMMSTPKTNSSTWVYIMKHLFDNKARNKAIVDQVVADLKAGHNIVIPVIFKKHALELNMAINRAYGKNISEMFTGGGTDKNKKLRESILSRAKAGTTRVVVGIRSMIQLGLNVPAWSCIYEIAPISNEPNLKQETSRVRTPMEGKLDPIIRLFVDKNVGASFGCARSTIKHMQGFGYAFDKASNKLVYEILSGGKQSYEDDDNPVDLLDLEARSILEL